MAAVQDFIQIVEDFQVVAVDGVQMVKGGSYVSGLLKLLSDVPKFVADVAVFAPEAAEMKAAQLADYQQVEAAVANMVFAVVAAVIPA